MNRAHLLARRLRPYLPEAVKPALRAAQGVFYSKRRPELGNWRYKAHLDGGTFANDHYRDYFLAMAGEPDDGFVAGKVVADFGCGPRGSLAWARPAIARLGIDVLATRYVEEFAPGWRDHGRVYVQSTERHLPLGDDTVDLLFSLNALDHVRDFERVCDELYRVVRPGGEFVLGFNLTEPTSPTEPHSLTLERIGAALLDRLDVTRRLVSAQAPPPDRYAPMFAGDPLPYSPAGPGFLWVRATKPHA